ncbi:hypothetical protein GGX14DRAFT_569981 [Mycena pura]|uniref:Uncharacterized protein n=1 Tax=Mycena pura TaxID=153505 RepID=A0AAD6Y660_9AGAR|nr:hypothetical protein GGX14DRAFT_569981 [Mycena pura]
MAVLSDVAPYPYDEQLRGLTVSILGMIQQVKDNKAGFCQLAEDTGELVHALLSGVLSPNSPKTNTSFLNNMVLLLSEIKTFILKHISRNSLHRMVTGHTNASKIRYYDAQILQAFELLKVKRQITTHEGIFDMKETLEHMRLQLSEIGESATSISAPDSSSQLSNDRETVGPPAINILTPSPETASTTRAPGLAKNKFGSLRGGASNKSLDPMIPQLDHNAQPCTTDLTMVPPEEIDSSVLASRSLTPLPVVANDSDFPLNTFIPMTSTPLEVGTCAPSPPTLDTTPPPPASDINSFNNSSGNLINSTLLGAFAVTPINSLDRSSANLSTQELDHYGPSLRTLVAPRPTLANQHDFDDSSGNIIFHVPERTIILFSRLES